MIDMSDNYLSPFFISFFFFFCILCVEWVGGGWGVVCGGMSAF